MRRRAILSLLVALSVTLTATATPAAAAGPSFRLGFQALAGQIPDIVGNPTENEHYGPNGDSLQKTTTGLMVWRKADNWTAFTNGATTWINGPFGVQSRPNDRRFDWEEPARQPPAAQSFAQSTNFDASAEQAALDMINQSRQQNGVGPLAMDQAMRQVARVHAQDMSARGYFGHASPEGKSPFDLMKAAGISFGAAAENIGYSAGHASATEGVRANHDSMMAETPPEDGHRKNILNGAFHRVGIGVYRGGDGKVYFVSDFAD